MDSEQTSVNIGQLLGVLRRRALWILFCVLIAGGGAYAVSKHETKKYTTSASLVFGNGVLSEELAGLQPVVSSENTVEQEKTDVRLVRSGGAAAKTAAQVGHGLTAHTLSEAVVVAAESESNVVNVTVTETSPALAAQIANTYARIFVEEQRSSTDLSYAQAQAVVQKQLAALPAQQRLAAQGIALQERSESLAALAAGPGDVKLGPVAAIPSSPSSPRVSRNAALGAVLGLLLGLALALLLELLDRRIREPRDLEELYGVPLLGVIPQSTALSQGGRAKGKALRGRELEAFPLGRAHLRYFNIDRELRTLLIGSAAPEEGKTTLARHLAAAAASVGARVLLVEADLRRPSLADALEIAPWPGVADVLVGSASLTEAIQSVDLGGRGYSKSPYALDVLVAGVLPPNPGELIESRAMEETLAQTRSTYDLVVIDTSPLGPVSDAFPLLSRVDGVIIVGRIGWSRRDAAERLRAAIASTGAPLLGVIANGSRDRAMFGSSYDYEPEQPRSSGDPDAFTARTSGTVPVETRGTSS